MSINMDAALKCACGEMLASNVIACEACREANNLIRMITLPTPLGDTPTAERVSHDQKLCFNHLPRLVETMDIDSIFVFMKKMEACAAGLSLIHSQKLIKNRVGAETEEAAIERKSTFAASVKATKDAQRPKKERKILDQREKGIAALVAIGMSEADAIASVDSNMAKAGRKVTANEVM
jgi:hypothetical protein